MMPRPFNIAGFIECTINGNIMPLKLTQQVITESNALSMKIESRCVQFSINGKRFCQTQIQLDSIIQLFIYV